MTVYSFKNRAASIYTQIAVQRKMKGDLFKMETKSNGFLKVTGILMIIGGVLGFIVGIIAVLGVAVLAAAGASSGLLTVASLLVVVSSVVSFIAGIVGVANAARPEKAQTCIVFGILVVALSILGNILTVVAGGKFSVPSLFTGLVIPVLYLIGAFQNKSRA